MTCPHCGTDTPAGAARCAACGAPQGAPTVEINPRDLDVTGGLPDAGGFATIGGATPAAGTGTHELDIDVTRSPVPASTKPTGGTTGGSPRQFTMLTAGQTLGVRYHIIRLLGVGGMGAVYHAWDAELGVAVALKVIRGDITGDPDATAAIERQFKRELLLARQVTHKHVVRIHDLGDIDGLKYITMPYVQGADLASILKEAGTLPIARTLRYITQIVGGLVAAHEAGVVHRDLKPANIMIDEEDSALIMDFGIAHSSSAGATGAEKVVGTLAYMAPEQAQAKPTDQRADVYALGMMLREMLVGRKIAGDGQTALADLMQRIKDAPPRLRTIDATIPEPLDELAARCVEPDPDKRYQSSAELAAVLAALDENGVPIPEPRRFTPRLIAASVMLVAALVTGTWWLTRTPPPPKPHDPVAVVIADFENTTGDPAFDHTLEQTFRRALEGAGFISAYDRSRIRASLGVPPPAKLDEVSARELAVKQGLAVVLSGSIANRGNGFEISVKASQTATGEAIVAVQGRASNKDQVLGTAAKLATTVRKGLGDQTSGSAQLLGMKGLSTASLAAVSHYAAAVDLQSKGKYDEAIQSFRKAVETDPQFGLAYQGLAAASKTLGRLQDSEKYAKEALRYLDGMTERERLATRGNYYRMTGDFQQCAKEYRELIARYAADTVALNNVAVCLAKMRDMAGAVNAMRQAVQILPNRVTYRANLALFADYAGDFATAEGEVRSLPNPDAHGIAALALSQLGQGLLPAAAETYQKLATMDAWGASFAASGLGDIALYEGRFSDAVRILEQGAAADLLEKNADNAAMKFAAVAHAHVMRGQMAAAIAAADKALLNSNATAIRFLTARVLVEAGAVARAASLAGGLASELAVEPQAYGKIVEGEIALKNGDARQAIKILTDATAVLDTWLGHFDLGRAYLALDAFPQADSEFDRCIKRHGEALSLLDEDPTYGYLPPAYYYLGRAREGLKTAAFADSYREYLKIRGKSTEDPLLPEIRRRAGR